MSAYSATPAPPARIRIVSHPPLAPLRAWLPLPTFSTRTNEPATVRDLLETIKGMLRTSDEIEIELQGFAVFENSPLSILDPTNDILDIKLGQPLRAPSFDSKLIYRNAQEGTRALPPASVPLPASSSSSSTTSSSSSSSSNSDSDDEAPETLPSKRPLTASTKTASPRPSKRRKREVMTATSNLTSSDSSSSSSDSSDSTSSSSSDSESDSDSDSEPATKAQTPQPSDKASGNSKPTVAPGSGLKRTHKRNLRKRTLRIAKAKERNEKLGAGPSSGKEEGMKEERTETKGHGKQDEGISEGLKATAVEKGKGKELEGIDVAPSTSSNTAQPSPVRKSSAKSLRDPYSDYAASLAHPTPQQQFTSPSTPTLLRDGSEPGISSVGPGRGNLPHPLPHAKKQKKKNNKGSQQKIEESIALAQDSPPKPSRASPSYTPASPNYSPLTPPLPTVSTSGPPLSAKTKEERQFPPRFPFPNQRTDLPPWMVVTSVNVEKKGWEPGVGKRVRGTSKEWSGWNAVQARVEITTNGEDEINTKQTSETVKDMVCEDWKTKEEIESAWNGLRKLEKLEDTKVGAGIAIKVLELDPSTFNPTISLKYGRLLSPTPDASLRVRLHPSCQPIAEFNDDDEAFYDEQGEEDGYYAEEDSEYGLKKKLKFGQDAFGDDEEKSKEETDVWEGDWTGEVRSLE
ncbi:hypothetical protein JCM5350_006280 [Sporobolomyces pararoseus]